MCGICGVVSRLPGQIVDEKILRQMGQVLSHRGPDDEGYYIDRQVGLGMSRLSIIDLTTGRQPISNENRSLWVVFNGEIYNYRELTRELQQKGHVFISKSDTEVIVHAYEEYGERCVEYFNGMFAFAIWDASQQRLFLARDRLGIKPLYYWVDRSQIIFGSELKALLVHPAVPRNLDFVALDQFLTLEYVPAPRTIFSGVCKLPAGHRLTFHDGRLNVEQYWDISPREIPEDESTCVEMLGQLIHDAVRLRMVSDVPLGAFLSGGIDSSTIVACMSKASSVPINTFSIGFEDASYNELPFARAVATHFGAKHTEEVLEPDIAALAECLVGHLDEPLGDFSIFPTYLVSKLAAQSVKVVLSGDGGDEIFGGYDTYLAQQVDHFYRWLPAALRQKVLPVLVDRVPPQPAKKGFINKTKRFVEGAALPASLQHSRWMMFLNDAEKNQLYQPALRDKLNGDTTSLLLEYFDQAARLEPLARQQYVDIKTYLAENILTKVDRMSMAVSLEARVPLLDYRIVEFALSLPPHLKLRRGQTKVILRRAMGGQLPETVLNKPKQGFSIPLKRWLCGPLQPLMMDLLNVDVVRRRGYFQIETVTRWISEHLGGRANHSHRLWGLMVFELWHRQVLERGNVAP